MNIKKMAVIMAAVLSLGGTGYTYANLDPAKKASYITTQKSFAGDRVTLEKRSNGVLIHNKSNLPIKVTTLRSVHQIPAKKAILIRNPSGIRTVAFKSRSGKPLVYHVVPTGKGMLIHKANLKKLN